MNKGRLTSVTYCTKCRLPIEILPEWTEVTCKRCNTPNNLIMKDFWCNRDEKKEISTGFTIAKRQERKLNVDKIKTLEDVKRILEFLDIKVETREGLTTKGFDKVEDLFD